MLYYLSWICLIIVSIFSGRYIFSRVRSKLVYIAVNSNYNIKTANLYMYKPRNSDRIRKVTPENFIKYFHLLREMRLPTFQFI